MATHGFYFSRLEVRGRGKTTAQIEFAKGLTVISGASDTGKSYLVQCLDFMTGGGDVPEPIDEAAGYESVWLEIISWTNEVFTLERALRGGDFRLYKCSLKESGNADSTVLKAKHKASKKIQSASEFLLGLCGLDGVELLAKKKGDKWGVSFRQIAHLVIVSEEQIYTKRSPVHASGIVTQRTFEESLFKYLITGVDDASVIADAKVSQTDGDSKTRRDTLQAVIESIEEELLQLTDAPDEIDSQLTKVKNALDEATTAIAMDRDELRNKQVQRKDLWETIEATTGRLEILGRLVNRFTLLDRYYASDLKRLKAMSEVGSYLTQMPRTECPICGTADPWGSDNDLEQLQRAAIREIARIEMLQQDLSTTVTDIEGEVTQLTSNVTVATETYTSVNQQIDEQLRASEQILKRDLSQLLDVQSRLERGSILVAQAERLRTQLDEDEEIQEDLPTATKSPADESAAKTSDTQEFCKVVEKLLTDWKFPETGRVTFSERKQDLVINGKDRSSHGKGIRALSYAAFAVALLRFCRKVNRPYTGCVVLDSPLVAYREPDSQKLVETAGVKQYFYRSLAKKRKDEQVIVFENEDPPSDIADKILHIHFSGDKKGKTRTGFFPQ